jgi:opacity protein-like surface antigen
MKKLLVTLAILAMASSAMAITLSIGGGGGILLPLGDFADAYKLGFGFGGGASIGVIPLMNIDADFGYYLGMKSKLIGTTKFTVIPITFGASINIIHGGKFVPYAGGGGGFYLMKSKTVADVAIKYNKAGIYFGGGIKYFFTDKIALNVNPKFHVVFTDVSKTMFMTIGGGISYAVM